MAAHKNPKIPWPLGCAGGTGRRRGLPPAQRPVEGAKGACGAGIARSCGPARPNFYHPTPSCGMRPAGAWKFGMTQDGISGIKGKIEKPQTNATCWYENSRLSHPVLGVRYRPGTHGPQPEPLMSIRTWSVQISQHARARPIWSLRAQWKFSVYFM